MAILLALPILASKAQMPIISFYGPIIEKMSLGEYQAMRDCGFTHSLNIYNTLDYAVADLAVARKAGVKLFVHVPALVSNTTYAVARLKGQPALAGYFLADEPNMDDLWKYVKIANTINKIDRRRICYINLHPYYNDGQMKVVGTPSYRKYLQAASRIGLPQISFDFYPVTKDGLRADAWFYTLNEVRRESLRTGRPFWGYVLSVPHNDYPQPTLPMLRLQVYTNLAYGAQAITYFTYKTLQDKRYSFHNAPIGLNGKKTNTYALVRTMNKELRAVASLFYGAKVLSVGHLVTIPQGCKKASAPKNIRRLSVSGKGGAVVSVFSQKGHRYMAVVNKSYLSALKMGIEISSDKVRHVSKNLVESRVKRSYVVQPGDVSLFKLE